MDEKLGEFELIAALTRSLADGAEGVTCGVGDDAAVLRIDAGRALLATCDAQIEGVHFERNRIEPELLGRRLAHVNLSDIAAMGGAPRFALVALATPGTADQDWLEAVYRGLSEALDEVGVALVGGNTARLPERVAFDLFLLGDAVPEHVLRRDGARDGDLLCVTGTLGDSAAGLMLLEDPTIECDSELRSAAIARHLGPTARLGVGRLLGADPQASSCIDVSDGLAADAGHLARASGVSIEIDADALPVSASARSVATSRELDPSELALASGEEYELLFTVGAEGAARLLAEIERETGVASTIVGTVSAGEPSVTLLRDGCSLSFERGGFDHLR